MEEVIGGFDGEEEVGWVQRYNTITGACVEVAGMLTSRFGHSACFLDGYIYTVGGRTYMSLVIGDDEALATVERYDIANDRWDVVKPMNKRREGAGISVISGRIYVLGGSEWTTPDDTIECYDPADDTWKIVGNLPTSRAYLTAVPFTLWKGLGRSMEN